MPNTYKLFFATNRGHEGSNRWKPEGYGPKPSQDGIDNLRFGEVEVKADPMEVKTYLTKDLGETGVGDGLGLSDYILKQTQNNAKITAYKEKIHPTDVEKDLENHCFGSIRMFENLKKLMKTKEMDLLIYIHGFNVEWEEAVSSALSLQEMLKHQTNNKDLMVFLFSWPSDGSAFPFLAYKSDRVDAKGSGESFGRGFLKMRDYLKNLRERNNSKEELCFQKLHLLCHSMGNYVLESSLQKIIEFNEGKNLPRIFDEIFMCAPDVDSDVLEKDKPMGRISELAKRITIYHNSGDLPMIISDYTKGNPDRLGHQGSSRPILTDNKINQVNCSPIVEGTLEHSYYLVGLINKDIKENIDGLANNDPSRKRKMENILGNSFILS
jgi:Alpha/beta hydrolase of unknown function (DUF900)